MSEPHCGFFEASCGSKTFGRADVVFGAEVALGAVFVYDVGEAGGHCDAGYGGAETPVVFYTVCLVVFIGHEVHVALLRNQSGFREKGAVCSYPYWTPSTAHATAVLISVSIKVRS